MLENVTGTEIMWKEGNDLCFCEVPITDMVLGQDKAVELLGKRV
jgi:hypothetical protein